MSHAIVRVSNTGGTLAVVPASLVVQTVEKARAFFRTNFAVQLSGGRSTFKGMVTTSWEEENKKETPSDTMRSAMAEWEVDYAEPFTDSLDPRPETQKYNGKPEVLFREAGITLKTVTAKSYQGSPAVWSVHGGLEEHASASQELGRRLVCSVGLADWR